MSNESKSFTFTHVAQVPDKFPGMSLGVLAFTAENMFKLGIKTFWSVNVRK